MSVYPWRINGNMEEVTIGAASATHTTNFPAGTTHARLSANIACRVRSSAAGATVALATDYMIPAGGEYFLPVNPGEKITAIQDAAAGKLSVTPVTFC